MQTSQRSAVVTGNLKAIVEARFLAPLATIVVVIALQPLVQQDLFRMRRIALVARLVPREVIKIPKVKQKVSSAKVVLLILILTRHQKALAMFVRGATTSLLKDKENARSALKDLACITSRTME